MGMREDDYIIQLHRQAGWAGYLREIRHHHGDSGIDVTISIPPSSWSGLVTAAQGTEADFFAALAGIPGARDLLVDLGPDGLRLVKQLVLDLDAH